MYSSLLGSTFPPHIHGPKCVHDSVSIWKTLVHSCMIPSLDSVQAKKKQLTWMWITTTNNTQIAETTSGFNRPLTGQTITDVAE